MIMHYSWPHQNSPAPRVEAAELLKGLEALRAELGSIADELILMMRNAGVRPPNKPAGPAPRLH